MSVPLVFALDFNYLIRAGILVECKILNGNENASFSREATVALGYRLKQLLRFFRALQTSRMHP